MKNIPFSIFLSTTFIIHGIIDSIINLSVLRKGFLHFRLSRIERDNVVSTAREQSLMMRKRLDCRDYSATNINEFPFPCIGYKLPPSK